MAIADLDDLLDFVAPLMGTTWDQLTPANQALSELGWVLPESDDRKWYWILERTRRYSLYVLLIQFASKFRYKQIYLQQKFDNHLRMIEAMDAMFAKAMENDMSGIFDESMGDLENFSKYGFYMNPAGFVYDCLGRDLTYVD